MSGLGTAFAAAVNGFAAGREIKHGWEDRKDEKARQKRRDEILDAQEARAAQRHDLDMTTGGLLNDARRQSIRQTDQNWQDFTSLRGVMGAADEAASAGMGALPPDQMIPTGPATAKAPDQVAANPFSQPLQVSAPSAPLSFGRPAATGPVRAEAAQPGAPAPAPDTQVGPAQAAPGMGAMPDPDALFSPAPDGKVYTARPPRSPEEVAQIREAVQAGRLAVSPERQRQQAEIDRQHVGPAQTYSYEDWQGMSRAERTAADLPVSQLGGQGYFDRLSVGLGATPQQKGGRADEAAAQAWTDTRREAIPDPNQTGFQRDMGALRDGAASAISGAGGIAQTFGEQGVNLGVDMIGMVNAPFRAASKYFTGTDYIGAPGRVDLDGNKRTQAPYSPYVDLFRPGAETPEAAAAALSRETGKKVTPAGAEMAAETAQALDNAGDDPSMKAAADAISMSDLGANPGRPMSQKQRARAAKTYLESYRENGAPIVMRELMRQGRYDEAQSFDTFMRSQQAQAGMERWGEGMFAALSGDENGVLNYISDAYNTPGYYDDGYEVIRDESELIKDDTGNTVGIKLTMRHQATGQTFTQTGNVSNIMQHFLWKTSPQEAAKTYHANQLAAQQALMESQQKRDAAATRLIEKDFAAQVGGVDDAAFKLMESSQFSGEPMTYEEARQRVIAARQGGGGGGAIPGEEEGPAVAYRPQ